MKIWPYFAFGIEPNTKYYDSKPDWIWTSCQARLWPLRTPGHSCGNGDGV